MWKFVTRGIRETFERRACRTNVYSQPSQDNTKNEVKTNLTCQQKFLVPIYLNWNKSFCGSAKSAGTGDQERDHKWNTKHTWPEAIGWSSVLAAGWIYQSLCLQKGILDQNERKKKLLHYTGVNQILTQIKNWQLKLKAANVLPVINCIGSSNNNNLQDSDSQWHAGKLFGPVTMEEAKFKEAADEFKNTHKLVVGDFELRYGLKALEEKRYKDAWTHFSQGAKLSSPSSMFNLALCYELGIGTLADPTKAAKYYKDAAAYDHADALYNLGIYHAQGKGGLPIDINTARTCFIKAAKLGQVQAQHALDLEKASVQSKENNSTSAISKTCLKSTNLETNKTSGTHEKLIDTITNFILKSSRDASGYNEEMVRDSTHVLVDLLSLKESRPSRPDIMTATDNCVPC
ncbi:uncharacterized protein LOC105187476 [Harpegnathos saltator]|uniref:uncharacterized protein LOC105187476 n=1 Tax=Harpegnathos saltator TaxID=610380 RepID=UPI0005916336|nr:uncharacterized protein LOC105187476 [Harpegnathos saltator]